MTTRRCSTSQLRRRSTRAFERSNLENCWSPHSTRTGRDRSPCAEYHQWSVEPCLDLTAATAADRAKRRAYHGWREATAGNRCTAGALLSGGIDSSLVSAAAQSALGQLRTFNVRFPDDSYDETWAAAAVARHIGSRHDTLDMGNGGGFLGGRHRDVAPGRTALCRYIPLCGQGGLQGHAASSDRGPIG